MSPSPVGQPELSFRARKILYAVISEYVATGEPVGSRRIAKRYGVNLSPATIRNVLSDLTDAGVLRQPHTSAGRVPTEQGFRLFVDALAQMRELTSDEQMAVMGRLSEPGIDDFVKEAGRLLATMAGVAAVITRPRKDSAPLLQLRFMTVSEHQLLAVVITEGGGIHNRLITRPEALDPSALERLNNYLQEKVPGHTIAEVRALFAGEVDTERGLRDEAKQLIEALSSSDDPPELLIEGHSVLFERPEFSDAENIRRYLRTFDDRERLVELLDRTIAAGGVQVLIGSETELGEDGEETDISLIGTSYKRRGMNAGTVGIIGPQRMDYAKLVPLVEFTAQVMGDVLDGVDPDDGE